MYLFLSPHFDDVVLSCGGFIIQLIQANQDVTVLTIMAGNPPTPLPQSPLIEELHARWASGENPIDVRRAEDQTAVHVLGAKTDYMTIPDCIYRTHNQQVLYPYGDNDLFGSINTHDPAKSHLTSYDLLEHFPSTQTLVIPLGIGNHVDHQIVRNWGLDLYKNQPLLHVYFYEDYPYSTNLEAIQNTVEHFPLQLDSTIAYFDEALVETKCVAIAKYRSQISTFWNTESQMKDSIHQHMRQIGNGTYAERYWIPADME